METLAAKNRPIIASMPPCTTTLGTVCQILRDWKGLTFAVYPEEVDLGGTFRGDPS
jgi:hypothetical protein